MKSKGKDVAVFGRIHALMRRGRNGEALAKLLDDTGRRIRKPYTENLNHAWYLIGEILYETENYLEAIKAYQKSYRNWSDDYQALWGVAECYSEMKRPRIAVRYWEKALSLAGHKDELIYNLGNAFFDLGEFAKAISCYVKVRKRSPSVYKLAAKNKRRANRILGLVK